jgi:pimeloyl-ACP methyl ester carboxylesterase
VRAARKLDSRVRNRVAIAGHSQGGHAAIWGAALAPKWTPELKVRGTVAFAPASHISELVASVRLVTSPGGGLSAEAALALRALDDFKPALGVQSLFTDKLAALYPESLTKCQPQLAQADSVGGLAPSELLRDDADLNPLVAALDVSDPENLTVKTPLAVEQGSADKTVFPALTDQLVKELRGRKAKIEYRKYKDVSHGAIVVAAADHATKYLKSRLR